jgi:serine/threonine-protein kinase
LGTLFLLMFFVGQAVLSVVLGGNGAGAAVPLSAAVTAVLFNPARARMRNLIDRRVYGFRFDLNELNNAQKTPHVKNPGALTGYTLGAYQVLGVLGKGGMGEVYQGQGTNGTVALKILPDDLASKEEYLKRFEREARALAAFDHPNIVKLYDVGESEGKYYMALEYLEGQELGDLIKAQGALALKNVRPFVQDFAAALDYAHSKGLVHRDIKPSNIMIRRKSDDETHEAVLMDFGIAKIQDASTGITGTGAIGTIEYMAPEQIMAAKEVDHRADIYALGVVLYEMLTGERPFKGSAGQVLFAHLQQPAPDPRDLNDHIPSKAAHAIMKAMAKNPEERFRSVGEFAAALT